MFSFALQVSSTQSEPPPEGDVALSSEKYLISAVHNSANCNCIITHKPSAQSEPPAGGDVSLSSESTWSEREVSHKQNTIHRNFLHGIALVAHGEAPHCEHSCEYTMPKIETDLKTNKTVSCTYSSQSDSHTNW